METAHVERLLARYDEGALPPGRQAAVADHLASCGACRAKLGAARTGVNALVGMDDALPPANLLPRIQAHIDARRRERGRRRLTGAAALAAVLLLAVGVAFVPAARTQAAEIVRGFVAVAGYMRGVVAGDGAGPPTIPDGQLAYADADGAVWLVDADGANRRRLIDDCQHLQDISWSPDGTLLACSGYAPGTSSLNVVIADAQGQVVHRLREVLDFQWSPGGHLVSYRVYEAGGISKPTGTYIIANLRGSTFRQIEGVRGNLIWNRDGSAVAYHRFGGGFVVLDLATTGGSREFAVDVPNIDRIAGWVHHDTALLLDSLPKKTMCTEGDEACRPKMGVLDLSTGRFTRLPALDNGTVEGISSDGSLVAIHGDPDGDGVGDLAVMNAATLKVTVIAQGAEPGRETPSIHTDRVVFSPDRRHILWITWDQQETHIYRGAVDGTKVEALATLPMAPVRFSPDVSRILYSIPGAPSPLYTANVDGSEARVIGTAWVDFAWRPRVQDETLPSDSPALTSTPIPTVDVRPCRADDLNAAFTGSNGVTGGQVVAAITLGNRSDTSCRLALPQVRLLDASGSVIPLAPKDGTPCGPDQAYPCVSQEPPVLLPGRGDVIPHQAIPGQAYLELTWWLHDGAGFCEPPPPTGVAVRLTLESGDVLDVPSRVLTLTPCGDRFAIFAFGPTGPDDAYVATTLPDQPPDDPAKALHAAQLAMDRTNGYRIEMSGHNLVLPRWGGIDSLGLDVARGGFEAAGTLYRTGDGRYDVVRSDGSTYFRRETCDRWARAPGGGGEVLTPFLWTWTKALRDAGRPEYVERGPGAIIIEADVEGLGRVRVELDPETYLPERLVQPRNPSNGTESTWTFTRWDHAPKVDRPADVATERGPGGNPC